MKTAPRTHATVAVLSLAGLIAAIAHAQPIYTDFLASGWQNWSWETTVSFTNASPALGAASIRVQPNTGFSGFHLNAPAAVTTADVTSLRFQLHGGPTGGQALRLTAHNAADQPGTAVTLTPPPANAWQQYDITLAQLGVTDIKRFYIQSFSSQVQQPYYIDDLAYTQIVQQPPVPFAEPIDPNLTPETRNLFNYLKRLQTANAYAFGHQLAGWEAVDVPWGQVTTSDWQAVTGTRPAVQGWDGNELLTGSDAPFGTRFSAVNKLRQQYLESAIITISWHMPNPALTGQPGNSYNVNAPTPTVPRIIPGGDLHTHFVNNYLDPFADMLEQLVDLNGKPIPVIVRPFHEATCTCFWWGVSNTNDFKSLWRFTVEYLRDTRGLHHLIYAFSPNAPTSQAEWDNRYDAAYVDIVASDQYRSTSDPAPDFQSPLRYAIARGRSDGKIIALTELGPSGSLIGTGTEDDNFWFGGARPSLQPLAGSFAYTLTWANWDRSQYYLPYPGSRATTKTDFINFLNAPEVLHLDEMHALLGTPYAAAHCSPADLAAPLGTLDIFDVLAYFSAFASSDPVADFAAPLGRIDVFDVLAFFSTFGAGC